MVETTLTDNLIRSGEDLVRRLDESDLTICAALWFYFSDLDVWRLVLGIKETDELGPKEVYRKIQSVLHKLKKSQGQDFCLSLDEITVIEPKAPLLELLRLAVRTGDNLSGIRFSHNAINGQLIEDAYIYRLL